MQAVVSGSGRDGRPVAIALALELDCQGPAVPISGQGSGSHLLPAGLAPPGRRSPKASVAHAG